MDKQTPITFSDCVFTSNRGRLSGAVSIENALVNFLQCEFRNNSYTSANLSASDVYIHFGWDMYTAENLLGSCTLSCDPSITYPLHQYLSPCADAADPSGAGAIDHTKMCDVMTNDGVLYVSAEVNGKDTYTCRTDTDPCATIAGAYQKGVNNTLHISLGTFFMPFKAVMSREVQYSILGRGGGEGVEGTVLNVTSNSYYGQYVLIVNGTGTDFTLDSLMLDVQSRYGVILCMNSSGGAFLFTAVFVGTPSSFFGGKSVGVSVVVLLSGSVYFTDCVIVTGAVGEAPPLVPASFMLVDVVSVPKTVTMLALVNTTVANITTDRMQPLIMDPSEASDETKSFRFEMHVEDSVFANISTTYIDSNNKNGILWTAACADEGRITVFRNVMFRNIIAGPGFYSAIAFERYPSSGSPAEFTDCLFDGCVGRICGAVYIGTSASILFTTCRFRSNFFSQHSHVGTDISVSADVIAVGGFSAESVRGCCSNSCVPRINAAMADTLPDCVEGGEGEEEREEGGDECVSFADNTDVYVSVSGADGNSCFDPKASCATVDAAFTRGVNNTIRLGAGVFLLKFKILNSDDITYTLLGSSPEFSHLSSSSSSFHPFSSPAAPAASATPTTLLLTTASSPTGILSSAILSLNGSALTLVLLTLRFAHRPPAVSSIQNFVEMIGDSALNFSRVTFVEGWEEDQDEDQPLIGECVISHKSGRVCFEGCLFVFEYLPSRGIISLKYGTTHSVWLCHNTTFSGLTILCQDTNTSFGNHGDSLFVETNNDEESFDVNVTTCLFDNITAVDLNPGPSQAFFPGQLARGVIYTVAWHNDMRSVVFNDTVFRNVYGDRVFASAIDVISSSATNPVLFIRCIFSSCVGRCAGAISINGPFPVFIHNCSFSNNRAFDYYWLAYDVYVTNTSLYVPDDFQGSCSTSCDPRVASTLDLSIPDSPLPNLIPDCAPASVSASASTSASTSTSADACPIYVNGSTVYMAADGVDDPARSCSHPTLPCLTLGGGGGAFSKGTNNTIRIGKGRFVFPHHDARWKEYVLIGAGTEIESGTMLTVELPSADLILYGTTVYNISSMSMVVTDDSAAVVSTFATVQNTSTLVFTDMVVTEDNGVNSVTAYILVVLKGGTLQLENVTLHHMALGNALVHWNSVQSASYTSPAARWLLKNVTVQNITTRVTVGGVEEWKGVSLLEEVEGTCGSVTQKRTLELNMEGCLFEHVSVSVVEVKGLARRGTMVGRNAGEKVLGMIYTVHSVCEDKVVSINSTTFRDINCGSFFTAPIVIRKFSLDAKTPTMTCCVFDSCVGFRAGSLAVYSESHLILENCMFLNNTIFGIDVEIEDTVDVYLSDAFLPFLDNSSFVGTCTTSSNRESASSLSLLSCNDAVLASINAVCNSEVPGLDDDSKRSLSKLQIVLIIVAGGVFLAVVVAVVIIVAFVHRHSKKKGKEKGAGLCASLCSDCGADAGTVADAGSERERERAGGEESENDMQMRMARMDTRNEDGSTVGTGETENRSGESRERSGEVLPGSSEGAGADQGKTVSRATTDSSSDSDK